MPTLALAQGQATGDDIYFLRRINAKAAIPYS